MVATVFSYPPIPGKESVFVIYHFYVADPFLLLTFHSLYEGTMELENIARYTMPYIQCHSTNEIS